MARQNKRSVGTKYETIAADYLLEHGYAILERNHHNPFGELDIIAEKDNIIIYIEIKYRAGNHYGNPLEAVDDRKQQRISRAAFWHYARCGANFEKPCRFDVIGIEGNGRLTHVENAFEFQGFD